MGLPSRSPRCEPRSTPQPGATLDSAGGGFIAGQNHELRKVKARNEYSGGDKISKQED